MQGEAREDALAHAQAEGQRIDARIETMYLDKLDGRITTEFFDEKQARGAKSNRNSRPACQQTG